MSTNKLRLGCSNVKRTLAIRDHLAKSIRLQSEPKTLNSQPTAGTNRCDENRLKLIRLFKEQELLWNERNRSHGSESLRSKAWRILAKAMGMSVETCQQLVQRIRASYEFKRKSLTSYQLAKGQPEWFYVAESFLRPTNQPMPPPPSPAATPEPEIRCREFIISVKKEKVDDYVFANLYPELEIPQVEAVKTETSEVITSKTTCRTCLTTFTDNQLEELASVDEEWEDQKTFRQLYVELIGPTEPRLPSVICSKCAEMLQRFFEFRTICLTNAKLYLETVSQIYSEHNYDQPEVIKGQTQHMEVDNVCEAGDDGEHEDTIVFVEPLPKLVKQENVIEVVPVADILNIEEKPVITADVIDDSAVKTERIFMDKNEYTEAKKKNYMGKQKYLCSICGQRVESKRQHMRKYHKELEGSYNEQCPHCPRNQFKTKTIYLNHLKWAHKRGQEIKCKFCDLVFACYTSRTCHQQEVHERLLFPCPDCDKYFKTSRLLRVHQLYVHRLPDPDENRICGTCGKAFANQLKMLKHQRLVHTTRLYYCDKCDFSVKTRRSLLRHFRVIHPPDGKAEVFKCDLCETLFRDARYLRNHVALIHEKRALYGCPVCEESFVHGKQLRRHVASWHPDSKLPPKGSKLKRVYLNEKDRNVESQVVAQEVEIENSTLSQG